MLSKRLAIITSFALVLPLLSLPADANSARREARQQLNQDRQVQHAARQKLQADKAAGNRDAIAADKTALHAAHDKVKVDRQNLRALRK